MEKFWAFIGQYSFGFFEALQAYCKWAERHAKDQKDLALLGLGPMALIAIGLLLVPKWIGIPILVILSVPFLYLAYLVLRVIATHTKR